VLFTADAGSDGSTAGARIWAWSDRIQGCKRGGAAENVYGPLPSSWGPADYFNGWMNSKGHRDNILNPAFTHMAVALGGSGNSMYGTQVFFECRQ
jgi:uncharacterized protein YkwD